MEARVKRFQDLIRFGRPFKIFQLVLLEMEHLAHTKNRRKAAVAAQMSASFYGLPELDPDWSLFVPYDSTAHRSKN